MHLSASGSTLRNVVQKAWACSALVTSHLMFLLAVSMLVQRVTVPVANQQAIGAFVDLAVRRRLRSDPCSTFGYGSITSSSIYLRKKKSSRDYTPVDGHCASTIYRIQKRTK